MNASPIVAGVSMLDLHGGDQPRVAEFCRRCTDFFELVEGQPGGSETAVEILGPLPERVASGTKRVFGIERSGDLIGVVELLDGFPGHQDWYVGLLVLLPDVRRGGLGTAVWRGLCDWIQGRDAAVVRVVVQKQNPSARTFWERQGFTIEAETVAKAGRIESPVWKMVRPMVSSRGGEWYPRGRMSTLEKIGPGDPRYLAVVEKRFNKRWRASPDYVRLVGSTDQVVSAVAEAVREGRRVAVTSGGHCLEGFVSNPEVRVIIDVSPMKRVYHDTERGAVAVEAGATVGETFRALFETWGVVIPLGEYPGIGMGGHVAGGAFGFLCRQLGLAADYLYAVEVVTVDEGGRASSVVATRETSDPHRDLWWAHTGGGAGNFGVVTRYWFRSPGATGADPATLLPRAPESITTFKAEWNWSDIDQSSFARLVENHGVWCERNSGADSACASLFTLLELHRKQFGKIVVRGVSTAGDAAERQADDHLAALGEGVGAPRGRELARMSWLAFALDPLPDLFTAPPGGVSVKVKDALLRKRFTDRQIGVAYDYLTSADHDVMGGMLGLATYGGRINTVAPDATASAQRDSILDTACTTGWVDPRDEAKNLSWVRAFYRGLFADSGGVPVPGEVCDGAFINHPDTDLADPALNTSGVPWHTLYYKANYPRLQRIKARWDPQDVFRHALSIRPG